MLLAIETSCDETSAAVIRDGCVLSCVVASQIKIHAEYGGVVPELAVREHLRNLPPVVSAALSEAKTTTRELDALAVTQGPGLPTALLAGLKMAQGMAFALRKPLYTINHHEAHLYSPWISGQPPVADFAQFQPNLSLIVSGGHTMLVHVSAELEHKVLGSTYDDAAGECFDKIAKLIGLPYPGGPEMDRLGAQGNPSTYTFPRPLLYEPNDDFSFSGLKTSVRYFLQKNPDILKDTPKIKDLCASVQAAIVETLVGKTLRAARRMRIACITASGGVTCNRSLRDALIRECKRAHLSLRLAERSLCTDNAAMIGILAERKLQKGAAPASLDADIQPGWQLS